MAPYTLSQYLKEWWEVGSIRRPNGSLTDAFVSPHWIPGYRLGKDVLHGARELGVTTMRDQMLVERKLTLMTAGEQLPNEDARVHMILNLIRRYTHDGSLFPYAHVHIRRCTLKDRGADQYLVQISGEGALFCHNKGSRHNHAEVWFQVIGKPSSVKGYPLSFCLVQRCYSTHEYNSTCCNEYVGPPLKLSNEEIVRLFPTTALNTTSHSRIFKTLDSSTQSLRPVSPSTPLDDVIWSEYIVSLERAVQRVSCALRIAMRPPKQHSQHKRKRSGPARDQTSFVADDASLG
jgi:hypothetical protein